MADLKFYQEERERQEALSRQGGGRCSPEEAAVAIRKLQRHYKTPHILLYWTSGNRYSKAWYGDFRSRIDLNVDQLSWVLVAHEFGHILAHHKRNKGHFKFKRAHCKKLERVVDRVCAYIVKMGWHQGVLAHGEALKDVRQRPLQIAAACPPPIDTRIAKKAAQVKRLETKVKALTTRLRNARRSLAAMERWMRRKTNGDK